MMGDDKYTILAREILALFEKRLGKFSVQDFDQVAEIIRAECSLSKAQDVDTTYENLSQEEKDQVDFMMGL